MGRRRDSTWAGGTPSAIETPRSERTLARRTSEAISEPVPAIEAAVDLVEVGRRSRADPGGLGPDPSLPLPRDPSEPSSQHAPHYLEIEHSEPAG